MTLFENNNSVKSNFDNVQEITASVAQSSTWVAPLMQEVSRVIVGQKHLVQSLIVALLADGHVLLEGLPGLAKTLTLKTLAKAIQIDFNRIQFTPDMLPADIIGTVIYNHHTNSFEEKKGPIFSNFVLADEINRAPAKVQSALLEAMEERQVTIREKTHKLDAPFLVMATQNPIEQEGTYPLPEAQIDRFMMKVVIGYPTASEEIAILDLDFNNAKSLTVQPIVNAEQILNSREIVNSIFMDEKIKEYIVSLVYSTRTPKKYGLDLEAYIKTGASPRATINLAKASKAIAYMNGRGYVTPQDVKSVAMDVLRHRVAMTYEAEAEEITSEMVVQKVLDMIPVP